MQIHGPSEVTDRVEARLNPGGTGAPFGVLRIGSVEVYVHTRAEAGKLALAAADLERLLLAAGEGDAK